MVHRLGIIPAGAGLTIACFCGLRIDRDHPRGCGAHRFSSPPQTMTLGSSPRVRGSPGQPAYSQHSCGIIPAGAGLTYFLTLSFSIRRDHPRGCGAHEDLRKWRVQLQGSSPRVRGSQRRAAIAHAVAGIIPAGAGLTIDIIVRKDERRDHPRGCGAHFVTVPGLPFGQGSSPRVRGSRASCDGHGERSGIIPAGAGLTRSRSCPCRLFRDHPRGCGAHTKKSQ